MAPDLIDLGFAVAGAIGGTGLTMVWIGHKVETLTSEREEARAVARQWFDTANARMDLIGEQNAELKELRAELAHWKPARGERGRFLKPGSLAA